MTENQTETTKDTEGVTLVDPPEDREGGDRYAIYDRQLARFVGGVSSTKPTSVKKDHGPHAVVVVV